ncbi:MAG: hypothetical protein SynsKO_03570 [Synoicihabitans sp.]
MKNVGKIVILSIAGILFGWFAGKSTMTNNKVEVTSGQDPVVGENLIQSEDESMASQADSHSSALIAWEALFADDKLRPLVEALRSAGFSDTHISWYLDGRLHASDLYLDLVYPLNKDWWRGLKMTDRNVAKLQEVQRMIAQQISEVMFDRVETEAEARIRKRRWGDLSKDKIEAVEELLHQRTVDEFNRQAAGREVPLHERYVKFHEDLRVILSDAEYRDYLVRNGDQSRSLRTNVRFLELTETQFSEAAWILEMVQLEAQKSRSDPDRNYYALRESFLRSELEIREVLGDETYFDYSRQSEVGSSDQKIEYTGEVPPVKILAAMDIRLRMTEELADIWGGYSAENPIRNVLVAQSKERHRALVESMMTAAEFEAYCNSRDGRWAR